MISLLLFMGAYYTKQQRKRVIKTLEQEIDESFGLVLVCVRNMVIQRAVHISERHAEPVVELCRRERVQPIFVVIPVAERYQRLMATLPQHQSILLLRQKAI